MPISEIARAKVNLTLRVLGRRPDGYHEIESLVTFAEVGDGVTLYPGTDPGIVLTGPFADDIAGPNLLDRTLTLLREVDGDLVLGGVVLEKNLPVAAGLGGGSADAAALLRAVRRANPSRASALPWHEVALRLGADVPVCLADTPAMMRGIGGRIEPSAARPGRAALSAVLINPRRPLTTARVFAALAAGPVPDGAKSADAAIGLSGRDALVAHMHAVGNDLERAAVALLPLIAEAKAALAAQPDCLVAAMSGSGPTCFGIFADDTAATRAADGLARHQPHWWTVATRLECPA